MPIQYLSPAEFTLPADVRTVAFVERVGRAQSETAVQGLEDALASSPRLVVANPAAAKSGLAAVKTPVGKPLDAARAVRRGLAIRPHHRDGDQDRDRTPAGCDTCEPVAKEVTEEVPMVLARCHASRDTGWEVP